MNKPKLFYYSFNGHKETFYYVHIDNEHPSNRLIKYYEEVTLLTLLKKYRI